MKLLAAVLYFYSLIAHPDVQSTVQQAQVDAANGHDVRIRQSRKKVSVRNRTTGQRYEYRLK